MYFINIKHSISVLSVEITNKINDFSALREAHRKTKLKPNRKNMCSENLAILTLGNETKPAIFHQQSLPSFETTLRNVPISNPFQHQARFLVQTLLGQ